jgi:Tfp pilus assembly protein PilV
MKTAEYDNWKKQQQGVTLIIALIMLVLITLIVTTAFSMSTANLKSVGNMQVRDEAIAAANLAIEQVISSNFIAATADEEIIVDIDQDGTTDYTVIVEKPKCVKASQATGDYKNDEDHPGGSSSSWNTIWEIAADVTDQKSGASVLVRQGVRALLSESQKNSLCT